MLDVGDSAPAIRGSLRGAHACTPHPIRRRTRHFRPLGSVRPLVDHTSIADDLLDRLPTPAHIRRHPGRRARPQPARIRHALSAVLARSAASGGFTIAEFIAKVHAMTGQTDYTIRQAAYDLRKLRRT